VRSCFATLGERLDEVLLTVGSTERAFKQLNREGTRREGTDCNVRKLEKFTSLSYLATPRQPWQPCASAPLPLVPVATSLQSDSPNCVNSSDSPPPPVLDRSNSKPSVGSKRSKGQGGSSALGESPNPSIDNRERKVVDDDEKRRQMMLARNGSTNSKLDVSEGAFARWREKGSERSMATTGARGVRMQHNSTDSSTILQSETTAAGANKTLDKLRRSRRGQAATRIWTFLEEPVPGQWSYVYVQLMATLILVSVWISILRRDIHKMNLVVGLVNIQTFGEFLFDSVFTAEILVRFTVCPNKKAFFSNTYNILDVLIGVVPLLIRIVAVAFLADTSDGDEEDSIRITLFCFVPVLRILKLLRHFEKFHLLLRAFEVAFEALPVLVFTQAIIILFFGATLYVVEPRDNIATIDESFFFALVTMSTVGYGDTVPSTRIGQYIVCILIVCGGLYMAIPFGIVGNAFSEVWADRDRLLVMKRTRDRLIQSGYTAQDIPALFALFDLSKTGELTMYEFSKMIKKMNVVLDNERLLKLFNVLDTDGGGTIDDKEFVRTLFPKHYATMYGGKQQTLESLDDGIDSFLEETHEEQDDHAKHEGGVDT